MKEFLCDVILPITAALILISGTILITAVAFLVIKDIFKK